MSTQVQTESREELKLEVFLEEHGEDTFLMGSFCFFTGLPVKSIILHDLRDIGDPGVVYAELVNHLYQMQYVIPGNTNTIIDHHLSVRVNCFRPGIDNAIFIFQHDDTFGDASDENTMNSFARLYGRLIEWGYQPYVDYGHISLNDVEHYKQHVAPTKRAAKLLDWEMQRTNATPLYKRYKELSDAVHQKKVELRHNISKEEMKAYCQACTHSTCDHHGRSIEEMAGIDN